MGYFYCQYISLKRIMQISSRLLLFRIAAPLVLIGWGLLLFLGESNCNLDEHVPANLKYAARFISNTFFSMAVISTVYLWFGMFFHWIEMTFVTKYIKVFWGVILILGFFLGSGSLLYYVIVYELKIGLKIVQEKQCDILYCR